MVKGRLLHAAFLLLLATLPCVADVPPREPQPYDELLAMGGRLAWDAPNFNRHTYSGPIFYFNHVAGQGKRLLIRYQTGKIMPDDQPAWLDLRIYDPQDHCILARDLQQASPGWHDLEIDLTDHPSGRYKASFTGWHQGIALATEPPTPIGLNGGYALGLMADLEGDQYLYIPAGIREWRLRASCNLAGTSLAVFDSRDQAAGSLTPAQSSTSWAELLVQVPEQDAQTGGVWRLHLPEKGLLRLYAHGVPGILWQNAEAAAANAGDSVSTPLRRVSHHWQATMLNWLTSWQEQDFALTTPPHPPMPDLAAIPDAAIVKAAPSHGLYGFMNQAVERLPGQLLTPASPWFGALADEPEALPAIPNPDAHNDQRIREAADLAWLYAYPAEGTNPYYHDPGVFHRAMAAYIQCWLTIGEHEVMACEADASHVFDSNSFAYIPPYVTIYDLLQEDIPDDLQPAFLDAITTLVHRCQHYDSYMSNQWAHILLTLEMTARFTGSDTFATAYERHLNAYLKNLTGSANMGQMPAGYYKENGGIDGNYNAMNEYMIGLLYRKTGDPRLRESLRQSMDLRRYLIVTTPTGSMSTALNWNHRTNASIIHGYPSNRLVADLPEAATIETRSSKPAPGHDAITWHTLDPERARESIAYWWNRLPEDGVVAGRGGSQLGGELSFYAPPINAHPPPLGCELPPPFIKQFGDDFMVAHIGPWYAVTYNGNLIPKNGPPGSGLALLWHHDLGPLILGATEIHSDLARKGQAPEDLVLTLTDAFTLPTGRTSTKIRQNLLTGDLETGTLSATITMNDTVSLRRDYTFDDQTMHTTATLVGAALREHDLYLPLVSSDTVTLTALDANGMSTELASGASITGFAWTLGTDKLQLTFPAPVPMEVRHRGIKAPGDCTLTVVKLSFGDQPGSWTIASAPPSL